LADLPTRLERLERLARLKASGVPLIDETPRTGLRGWRIAVIHPESCHGVLTELVRK